MPIHSKRELEGFVSIDHRNGGFTAEECEAAGLPPWLAGDKLFEMPEKRCSHCDNHVLINPDRQRARGYCPKCDSFCCDMCEGLRVRDGICRSFRQRADEHLRATKGL